MIDVAIAIPLMVFALGLLGTAAMIIRGIRRGRTQVEMLGLAAIFVMITAVLQSAGVFAALAIITVLTDRPIPIIDRIHWIPAEIFIVVACACCGLAGATLIKQKHSLDSRQWRRKWFGLAVIACFVLVLQWCQIKISDIVADSRHAIYYDESEIAFQSLTKPEPVFALRSRNVRHIELTNDNGEMIGLAVDSSGTTVRWNALVMRTDAGSQIVLPERMNAAFLMGEYMCGIGADARASCTTIDSASPKFVVDGRTSVFLPAPLCNGRWRMCALDENGKVRCFEENTPGDFREQSLPLGGGIRAMTPDFGCVGCFIEKSGHVRCLSRGLDDALISNDVEGISDAVTIASSLGQSCAIERDGRLFCWSLDAKTRMTDGNRPLQSRLIANIRAKQVSVAETHICAVDDVGNVHCWGNNRWGELCDGSRIDRTAPVSAMGAADAVMVSVENSLTCIVRRGGEVACCGKQRRKW